MVKKLFALVILVLVASLLVMPVFAASASMYVSASKGTVTRGETITVTVGTSSVVENCFSGGFMFSFNTDVFEYVGGSALVSGFASAGIYDDGRVSGYFMSTGSGVTVSGYLFQITLKVKDTAPYGTYSISGNPSMTIQNGEEKESVSCHAGSATVTVVCNHSYDSWTNLDDNQHSKTCSICGGVEKEDHAWGNDEVIKGATCKEGGQTKQTCSACSATRTISTDPTTDHKYGNGTKVNDNEHVHICSVCQKEETAAHSWDNGKVTKEPTCKSTGIKDYACTGCSATKTETLEMLTIHTYDHDCDTDCNVCGLTRETTHQYKTTWSRDRYEHWHECVSCKDKIDEEAHIPGAPATQTSAQTCNGCGYVIQAALGHTHNYATAWTTDEKGHWHACSGCEEKGDYVDHDFENACDPDCSICGYVRQAQHTFEEKWATDENNHWHQCTGCDLKQDEAAHEPGAEATATTAQTCTICDYEIAPALGVEETTAPTENVEETTTPTDQVDAVKASLPVALAVVIAVAIAGVIIAMPKKKK